MDQEAPAESAMRRLKKLLPRQSQVFFFLILGLMLYLTWLIFRDFIIYMLAGVFVAVLALPIDKRWEKLFPNRVAAFFTIFTLFIILTLPLTLIGIALYRDAGSIADSLDEQHLTEWSTSVLEVLPFTRGWSDQTRNETVATFVNATQEQVKVQLDKLTANLLSAATRFALAMTVILFVVYYVLTDGEKLVAYLRRALPLPPKQTDYLMHEARRGLQAVFVGQILTSLIQGVVGGIAFLITGVPGVILWSAVMAILSLLPVVGAFLVWLPAAVFLLVKGKIWQGIFMLAWGTLVVSQVDNFVRPKLIGDRADIHPLFVLLGVLGGVAAFGFIGLFLGPLLVGVTISILRVWERDYLDPAVTGHDETLGHDESA